MADFFARTEKLAETVGDGTLKGEFGANRIYAVNQHERGWKSFMGTGQPKEIRRYHQGGGPKFIESTVMEKWQSWYQNIGAEVLDGRAPEAVKDAMMDLDEGLKTRAPIRDNKLRRSGEWKVYDGKNIIASKPSEVPYEDPAGE